MNEPTHAELERVKRDADLLYSKPEIDAAVVTMAAAITARLQHENPLLLVTMTSGLVPAAFLLPHLDFPLHVDYLHLTRYGSATTGQAIQWVRRPRATVVARTVLLVDDLLDHGLTLQAAAEECRA